MKKTNKIVPVKTTKVEPAKKAPVAKVCAAAKAVKPVACECASTAKKSAKPVACACAATAKSTTTKSATTRVAFSVRAEVGSKVFIAGCFNNWAPTAKQLVDKDGTGVYACSLNLPKGKYEYKFVINGTWCADPECTDWVQNAMGTLNSVKIVD
ncbi:MAG: glycogen-binding domain-containing protein [Kiritimatiellia bacterium]